MREASRTLVVMISVATLAACRASDRDTSMTGDTTRAGVDTMGGMAGMRGTPGMMGAGIMDSMQTHMRMMDTMSADQIKAMQPVHRTMATNMLSQMTSDVQSMNMTVDAAWTATVDSVRQDLTRMADMSGPQLKAMMPAHDARLRRLMEMHQNMMKSMRH